MVLGSLIQLPLFMKQYSYSGLFCLCHTSVHNEMSGFTIELDQSVSLCSTQRTGYLSKVTANNACLVETPQYSRMTGHK